MQPDLFSQNARNMRYGLSMGVLYRSRIDEKDLKEIK